ncbi:MAG: chemotaxis protein CheA [Desulfuromonas sp.]|nr:MAG: chemotaxis protein CheA [Desulfuromonas sp.]
MSDPVRDAFREESAELLLDLENGLLELAESQDDDEIIGRIFRILHTIKGSGGMAGFEDVSAFAHEIEAIFEEVRNGHLEVSRELLNQTLAARDLLKAMIDDEGESSLRQEEARQLTEALRTFFPQTNETAISAEVSDDVVESREETTERLYRIRFRLAPDIFCKGVNPLYLIRELKQLGRCRVIAQVDEIPTLQEFDAEQCYVCWDLILLTSAGLNAIRDVFIFVEDDCELQIDELSFDDDEDPNRLGEILVERGDLSSDDLQAVLSERHKIGELLVEKNLVSSSSVDSALVEQEEVRLQQKRNSAGTSSIRVRSEKLDLLVDLIGELVTVQARLSQNVAGQTESELCNISEEVERLTWALRDQVLNIRMLPIGTTFSKFKRLVHDLSQELGKSVQLVTDGAETELDKTVIDRLHDPLVHLIRNCIDHGLESPQQRQTAGKPSMGTVHLSAIHAGAYVIIKVEDDGIGLDAEALREKGIAMGLIPANSELGDKELFSLILQPGFSTAKSVTSVSGRGVGMDVVRQEVESLRGTIEIESREGAGTCFSIKLPLTLAIIDGLLVNIGGDNFVMPLSAVEECIELDHRTVEKAHGRNLVHVRGEIVPYVRLRDFFEIHGPLPELEQVVIVEVEGERVGFAVDYVVGEHQTVIKALGKLYRHLQGISGATILGDGTVALILDLAGLSKLAEREEKELSA